MVLWVVMCARAGHLPWKQVPLARVSQLCVLFVCLCPCVRVCVWRELAAELLFCRVNLL